MTNQTKHLTKTLDQAYLDHQAIPFLNPKEAIDETLGYVVQDTLIEEIQTAQVSTHAGYKVSMTYKEKPVPIHTKPLMAHY